MTSIVWQVSMAAMDNAFHLAQHPPNYRDEDEEHQWQQQLSVGELLKSSSMFETQSAVTPPAAGSVTPQWQPVSDVPKLVEATDGSEVFDSSRNRSLTKSVHNLHVAVDSDLPVVELKPFTSGEWHRSRSYSTTLSSTRISEKSMSESPRDSNTSQNQHKLSCHLPISVASSGRHPSAMTSPTTHREIGRRHASLDRDNRSQPNFLNARLRTTMKASEAIVNGGDTQTTAKVKPIVFERTSTNEFGDFFKPLHCRNERFCSAMKCLTGVSCRLQPQQTHRQRVASMRNKNCNKSGAKEERCGASASDTSAEDVFNLSAQTKITPTRSKTPVYTFERTRTLPSISYRTATSPKTRRPIAKKSDTHLSWRQLKTNNVDRPNNRRNSAASAPRRQAATVRNLSGLEIQVAELLDTTLTRLRRTRTTTAVADGFGHVAARRCDVIARPTNGEARLMSALHRSRRPPKRTSWSSVRERQKVNADERGYVDLFHLPKFFTFDDELITCRSVEPADRSNTDKFGSRNGHHEGEVSSETTEKQSSNVNVSQENFPANSSETRSAEVDTANVELSSACTREQNGDQSVHANTIDFDESPNGEICEDHVVENCSPRVVKRVIVDVPLSAIDVLEHVGDVDWPITGSGQLSTRKDNAELTVVRNSNSESEKNQTINDDDAASRISCNHTSPLSSDKCGTVDDDEDDDAGLSTAFKAVFVTENGLSESSLLTT